MSEIMNTRLEKKASYTKSDLFGLAAKCDWFINGCELLKISDTNTPKYIFLSAWLGFRAVPFFANIVMPNIRTKFNLIIASEDQTFPYGIGDVRCHYYKDCQNEIVKILENPFVNKIYVENLDCNHWKCFPIPLGILKHNAIYHKYQRLFVDNVPVDFNSKKINVFCCHRNRPGPQWEKRAQVTELAKNNWKGVVTYVDEIASEDIFMENLTASKFCLCVQGGGYDPSPKCWQAILCGSIPIVEHTPLDSAYERFPVVFVNSWNAETISEKQLSEWMAVLGPFYTDAAKRKKILQMLSLDYWWSVVEGKIIDHERIAAISPCTKK